MQYNKLIRDRIPKIIKDRGGKPKFRRLNKEEICVKRGGFRKQSFLEFIEDK